MNGFPRHVTAALERGHDLIVVGGGIYGMMLTLEAARRGLRPLLLEKDDFGGAASLNSLRILHGGLRYLQSLDLPRFFESIEQRNWFMRLFAPLCRGLPCIMPLYGRGLKRPSTFRVALVLNNRFARTDTLPGGRVLSREETIGLFPAVPRDGLRGAGLWYDGQILSPQRLHAELLRWAAGCGASVLNYMEARELVREGGRVAGVATDAGVFRAPVVINAAGSWCREVATRFGSDQPGLMTPSLTFNVLLRVAPPSAAAVAVQGRRMYFVTPHQRGLTFVGTVHRAWEGLREPTETMVAEFLSDLQAAIPDWRIRGEDVLRVTPGVLPSRGPGEADMAHRSVFHAHETPGLFSVCGIKYTTAQRFSVASINRVFGPKNVADLAPDTASRASYIDPEVVMALGDSELKAFCSEESVLHPEDLLERRVDWIVDEAARLQFQKRLQRMLPASPRGQT